MATKCGCETELADTLKVTAVTATFFATTVPRKDAVTSVMQAAVFAVILIPSSTV